MVVIFLIQFQILIYVLINQVFFIDFADFQKIVEVLYLEALTHSSIPQYLFDSLLPGLRVMNSRHWQITLLGRQTVAESVVVIEYHHRNRHFFLVLDANAFVYLSP